MDAPKSTCTAGVLSMWNYYVVVLTFKGCHHLRLVSVKLLCHWVDTLSVLRVAFQKRVWALKSRIPHKMSYPHIQRCRFYPQVNIQEPQDLRAHKCLWNAPLVSALMDGLWGRDVYKLYKTVQILLRIELSHPLRWWTWNHLYLRVLINVVFCTSAVQWCFP